VRFKTDENLPEETSVILRHAGYDAHSVRDEALTGASDQDLMARADAENRILVTLDLDFADIRAYSPGEHAGIIVFRLHSQANPIVLEYVERVLLTLSARDRRGELWIVERNRIRFRIKN